MCGIWYHEDHRFRGGSCNSAWRKDDNANIRVKLSGGVQCLVNSLIPVDIEFGEAEKRKDYTIKCKCLTEIDSGSFEARTVGKEEKLKGE
jgi:hypothetical protein